MEIFGIEIKNKNKEREKMREYKKEKYKVFTFAVPETEYDLYKEFFKKYGGFTKFIKRIIDKVNKEKIKEDTELIEVFFSEKEIIEYLKNKGYLIEKKEIREKSIAKARQVRSEEIKRKIMSVVDDLKEKGETINPYKVSKLANINYRTAIKYLKEMKNV